MASALTFGIAGGARAAELPPLEAAGESTPLFVELVVNGQDARGIVPLVAGNGALLIAADDLRKAGVLLDGEGQIDVGRLPGVAAHYDAAGQRLLLDVPLSMLPTKHIAAEARGRVPTLASFGGMMNYDLYAQRSSGGTNVTLWSEQRLFGKFGTISNNGVWRIASAAGAPETYLRYDTRFRFVDEDRALAFTAGDLISRSLPWTTSVRMGGVQIARDYRVRPDLVTMPLPSFAGEAAVPSAVDLFIDGHHQTSETVTPGRFLLDSLPAINGAGEATIVTTDAVGRQIRTNIPFYVTPELLRQGLTDFAGELGFLRRGYGIRSFGYGAAAASATIRHGMTDRLTLEAHGEASGRLGLAGAGALWSPGLWGTLQLALAGSRGAGESGGRMILGYSYTGGWFSIAAEHQEQSRDFRDLGTFDLRDSFAIERGNRVVATLTAGRGNLGFAYLDAKRRGSPRARIASLSYALPLGRAASLFASADHDFGEGTTSAQLRLLISFGSSSAGAGLSRDPARGMLYQLDYSRAAPPDGGFGMNAGIATSGDGGEFGQASAVWRAPAVQIDAGGAFAGGSSSGWAGLSGAVVTMDGQVFAANRVSDAFAVVSTGVAGVPIAYENQPVGVTGRSGHLLVPQVTAYHPGRFSLDPLSLGLGEVPTLVETRIALREGVGALVPLPVRSVQSVTVTLIDAEGVPLAPGRQVVLASGRSAVVGWDGIVLLEDVSGDMRIEVLGGKGRRCEALVAVPANAPALAQLGAVTCV